jgi:hypothetical protein
MASKELIEHHEPGREHRHRHRHRSGAARTTEGAATPAQESAKADLSDRIAKRAYEIYLERGGEEGHALQDWLRAEREVTGS